MRLITALTATAALPSLALAHPGHTHVVDSATHHSLWVVFAAVAIVGGALFLRARRGTQDS
ncbi:MAG: hypothetical protein AAF411_31120 [Myxococcota bacterium]